MVRCTCAHDAKAFQKLAAQSEAERALCSSNNTLWSCLALFLTFVIGVVCGQAIVLDCNSGWNPVTYYSHLSSILSSPFATQEIVNAAREQKSAIIWTVFASAVGSLTLYFKGPEAALAALLGVLRHRPAHGRYFHTCGIPKHFSAADVAGGIVSAPVSNTFPQLYSGSIDGSGEYYSIDVNGGQNSPYIALFNDQVTRRVNAIRPRTARPLPLEIN